VLIRGKFFTLILRNPVESIFSDTDPKIEAVQLDLFRQSPPWRKLKMVGQLNQTAQTLAMSSLQKCCPQASPVELRCRLADLLLRPELAARWPV